MAKTWSGGAPLKSNSGQLPRSGAFQPEPPGQVQRSALDLPDVAGRHPMRRTLLGLAPVSPCWRPWSTATGSMDASIKSSLPGPSRWSCNSAQVSLPDHAGCPMVPLVLVGDRDCAISVSGGRLWSCSTAADRRLKPLPTSPACAWTPSLVDRRRPAGRARTVGLRQKANACRRRTHPSTHPGLSGAAAPVDWCDGHHPHG